LLEIDIVLQILLDLGGVAGDRNRTGIVTRMRRVFVIAVLAMLTADASRLSSPVCRRADILRVPKTLLA